MAQKIETTTICDLHADDDVEATAALSFTVDGRAYSLDACSEHNEQFERALAPFREVATATKAPRSPRTSGKTSGQPSSQVVRQWAQENGHAVAPNGRVPRAIVEKYQAAHR